MAKILAVDDSRSMREMVVFTLESAGHEVAEAEDGVKALAIAKDSSFDAVISDVNMPEMDGLTLIGELRALPDFRFVPILMLTTETSPDKKKIAKEAGATGWIVKPFNPDQLVQTVEKVLK